jgi:hypothetical protein
MEIFLYKSAYVLRFLILSVLFLILTPIKWLLGKEYSNCWLYVIDRYIREGGYIVFRRTEYHKNAILIWEHAFWTPDLKVFYSYLPKKSKLKRIIPPLLFKGEVYIKRFHFGQLNPEWELC